jgi:hypothetical protein
MGDSDFQAPRRCDAEDVARVGSEKETSLSLLRESGERHDFPQRSLGEISTAKPCCRILESFETLEHASKQF